ncbi:hypothetical protein [Derxia lacustris]|uniref:hypothetical protein n=1 Tax=Derxia lacustris TaxID=764842 RepID=UPI000A171161|nr:hypothetical protein [Derxia lacustris]
MPLRFPFSTALLACLAVPARLAGKSRRGLMAAIWALVLALTVFTVDHPALAEDFEEEVETALALGEFANPDDAGTRLSPSPGGVPVVPQAPGELPDMDLTLPSLSVLPTGRHAPPAPPTLAVPEPATAPLLRPPIG